MTQLDVTPPRSPDDPAPPLATAASHQAGVNQRANLLALSLTQPLIAHARPRPRDVEWVYARDGALTAKLGGDWWSGCSVPLQTARTLLRGLQVQGTACYLRPAHPAELAVALQRLPVNQAIIAVVPDAAWLSIALHCHDFSDEIRRNRLWFAVGPSWAEELRKILDDHPGLPAPAHVIRTPLLETDDAESLAAAVQRACAEATAPREALLKSLQERPRRCASSSVKRLCVLAPSLFRIWDDAGAVLADVLQRPRLSTDPIDIRTLNSDDPCSSGPLAVTLAARFCDVLVLANRTRQDLGPFIPPMASVISWMTMPAIPKFDPLAARDGLLLADSQWLPLAGKAGWPEHRVAVAQWPAWPCANAGATPAALALIADTSDVSVPPPALALSSHRLLWELINRELLEDPFAAAADIGSYLADRMQRLGIRSQNLDRRRFLEQLILPSYQQGLARLFLRERLPLRLHGEGWQQMGEFAAHAKGAVTSRAELLEAARGVVLVHAWPGMPAHPIEWLGPRILRPTSVRQSYLGTARRLLGGMSPPPAPHEPLTAQKILALL